MGEGGGHGGFIGAHTNVSDEKLSINSDPNPFSFNNFNTTANSTSEITDSQL